MQYRLATLGLLFACGPAAAETYRFEAPPVTVQADADSTARLREISGVQLNGQPIPAYGIGLVSPADEQLVWHQPQTAAAKNLSLSMQKGQAQRLSAYYHSWGVILVPRDWKLASAGLGANGSESLLFVPPLGGGYIRYHHTSTCVGCAQTAASAFFPDARADARANEFMVYDKTEVPVNIVRLQPHVIAYRAQPQGRKIDGIAYYNRQSDFPHWKAEAVMPPSQQDLAQPVLNSVLKF